jgi:hypothetical protein
MTGTVVCVCQRVLGFFLEKFFRRVLRVTTAFNDTFLRFIIELVVVGRNEHLVASRLGSVTLKNYCGPGSAVFIFKLAVPLPVPIKAPR